MKPVVTKYSETTESYSWIILTILLFAQLVMSMGAYAWGPVAPFIRDEYNVTRTQIGFLTSSLYLASVIVAVPSGFLVDRLGARAMLILCLFIMGCSFCIIPTAKTFRLAVIFSALGGIGYGVINQVSTKGIMIWFSRKTRATSMGIKQTGVTLGGAISAVFLPLVSLRHSWKLSILSVGFCMLLMALIAAIFYREKPNNFHATSTEGSELGDNEDSLTLVISNPILIILLVIMPFMAFSQSSVAAFLVLYLNEKINLSVEIAGSCLTAAMIAGTAGRIVWGVISDKLFCGDRIRPAILLSLCGAISIGVIGIIGEETNMKTVFLLSVFIGFTAIGWNALLMTLGTEAVGQKLAGTFTGISVAIAWVGIVSGPPLFGYLADIFSYQVAWLVLSFALFFSSVGFAFMCFLQQRAKSANRDLY